MQVIEPSIHCEMNMKWILVFLIIGWLNALNADGLKEDTQRKSFWDTYTSALRGDKIAQFQTGVIYERGIGVEVNQTHAALWYEKAAHQGYVDAQYNLALLYASGRGVEKNLDWAMIWLTKAAKQGDKEARALLLEIIDGKLDRDKPKDANAKIASPLIETITPVRFKTIEGGQICSLEGACKSYKANTTITSKIKSGSRYKVSGIGGKNGWQPYIGEGWIHEKDVQRD